MQRLKWGCGYSSNFFSSVMSLKAGIRFSVLWQSSVTLIFSTCGILINKPSLRISKQIGYHCLRLKAMLQSPGYFNRSLWDTLSGEYYRSFTEKQHYYHIFDYWHWDETIIDKTLRGYEWEKALDTNTTWRIGDGTAAFYNYIYYTVAGFTEHDTFRSNQVREGQLTREEALRLVNEENKPRYENIKWYLETIGMNFTKTIEIINRIPKPYSNI